MEERDFIPAAFATVLLSGFVGPPLDGRLWSTLTNDSTTASMATCTVHLQPADRGAERLDDPESRLALDDVEVSCRLELRSC